MEFNPTKLIIKSQFEKLFFAFYQKKDGYGVDIY